MRIAVTGASGFVGRRLVDALARAGHHVESFGRRAQNALESPLPNYRSWDLRVPLDNPPVVDAVIHCAALVGDWGSEAQYDAVNVGGTRAVIDTFADARVVFVSTSSVYSDVQPERVIREDAPTGDCRYSAYARTKAMAEQLVLRRGNAVVLRPHIVYGPGDSTLLPRLLAARRFGVLLIPGDGRNELSVTHVDNLVQAVMAAGVTHPHADGVFNVADATTATLRVLFRELFNRLQVQTRLRFVPGSVAMKVAALLEQVWPGQRPPRGPLLTRYLVHQLTMTHLLDISRARVELDYDPRLDFRTGPL